MLTLLEEPPIGMIGGERRERERERWEREEMINKETNELLAARPHHFIP